LPDRFEIRVAQDYHSALHHNRNRGSPLMLFHTWFFWPSSSSFFPVYLLINGTRLRLPWLLAASYVFYGWWNPVYLLLILWATSVDYLAVLAMAKSRWKMPWLTLSIVNNLGLLGFFKYGRFVVDNLTRWPSDGFALRAE
jgi:alginate O-acetyltransferase complex protein AlgI